MTVCSKRYFFLPGVCFVSFIFIFSSIFSPIAQAADIQAELDSSNGSSGLSVQNSSAVEKARIDSSGNLNTQGLEFMNTYAVTAGHGQTAQQLVGGNFSQQVSQEIRNIIHAQEVNAQKNDPAFGAKGITKDIRKIGIARDQDEGIFLDKIINDIVGGGWIKVADIRGRMPGLTDNKGNGTRTVGIDEEIHGLSAQKFAFIREYGRVENTGLDGLSGDRREFTQDTFNIHACSQGLQNDVDRGACSCNAGFSVLNTGIDTDVSANVDHKESIPRDEKLSNIA